MNLESMDVDRRPDDDVQFERASLLAFFDRANGITEWLTPWGTWLVSRQQATAVAMKMNSLMKGNTKRYQRGEYQ